MARLRGDILGTLPPRPLRPGERELVTEWLAAAGDVASAYVSDRRSDDPALRGKIVICVKGNGGLTHLVHTPTNADCWLVMRVCPMPEIDRFGSLREALNSIRPVLLHPAANAEIDLDAVGKANSPVRPGRLDRLQA